MARARAQTPKRPPKAPTPAPAPAAPRLRAQRAPATAPTDWRTHVLPLATLAVLATALYLPSLQGGFVYDDPNAVSQSTLIRHLTPLIRFLNLSTRPLTDYSFALDYAVAGLAPWPYHLTNILLHAGNVLLLYGIAWAMLATPPLLRRYGAARRAIAWAAAALFAAHPLASEGVGYISSRSEVLAGFWILLAFGAYIVAAATRRRALRRIAAAVVFLAAAAGLGSKEIAAAIPIALALYDWLFLAGRSWQRTQPRRWLLGLSLLPLAGGGAFLLIRAYLHPSPIGEYASTAGLGFDRFTRWEYAMSQFGVIAHYLRLIVLPIGQTFDYDWPLARTPFALGVVLPAALLVALVVLAVRAVATEPLAAFAVGWTLLILTPTSSVLPIADLAVERRMYLPLVMLMLLAAAWLWDLMQRLPAAWRARPTAAYAALVAIPLVGCAALTYERAVLWGDPVALHEDGVAKAPANPRVRLNLGVTYLNLSQQEKAYQTLLEAKTLYDRQESLQAFPRIGAFIQYNLGAVLYARKEYDRAEPELRRSIDLGGQYLALRPMAYMLLSRIASQHGDWKTAAADMAEAIKYQDSADWRIDLAQMQRRAGDPAAARSTLQQALVTYPGHQRATALLAQWESEDRRPAGGK